MTITTGVVYPAKTGGQYFIYTMQHGREIFLGPLRQNQTIAQFAAKMFAVDKKFDHENIILDVSNTPIITVCKIKGKGNQKPVWAVATLLNGKVQRNPNFLAGRKNDIIDLVKTLAEQENQPLFLPGSAK